MEEKLFSREEAAEYLNISKNTLGRLMQAKKITYTKIGEGQTARVIFQHSDLKEFLQRERKWMIRDSRKEILRLIPADAKKRNHLLHLSKDGPFMEIQTMCANVLKPWERELAAADFHEPELVEKMKILCGNVAAVSEVAEVDIPDLNPSLLHRLVGREIPLWEREIAPNLKLASRYFKPGPLKGIEMMAHPHAKNENLVAQRSVRVGGETYLLSETEWQPIPTPEPGEESGIFNSRYTARIRIALRTKKPISEREMLAAKAQGKSEAAQAQVDLEEETLIGGK